jgi:ssDNA-binding Zn-finger/Zn-ribbon topoisomerase 1
MRCPGCGAEMVVRIARKGYFKGKEFYGCSRYPECKAIIKRTLVTLPRRNTPPIEINTAEHSDLIQCPSCYGTGYRFIQLNPRKKKSLEKTKCNNCAGRGHIELIEVTGALNDLIEY